MWGHFSAYCIRSNANGASREEVLEYAKMGFAEIVVVSNSLFASDELLLKLMAVNWELIIVDEYVGERRLDDWRGTKRRAYVPLRTKTRKPGEERSDEYY